MKNAKVLLFAAGSAAVTALMAGVNSTCPELFTQWPALVSAAVMAGLGYAMKAPSQAWDGQDRRSGTNPPEPKV